jgi:hypothetical protein
MVTTKILGGLGNQMFQYAAARALAIKCGCPVRVDITAFKTYQIHNGFELKKFALDRETLRLDCSQDEAPKQEIGHSKFSVSKLMRYVSRKLNTIKPNFYLEKDFSYDADLLNQSPPVTIEGYWQSYKYFPDIRDQLLEDFCLLESPTGLNEELVKKISECNSVSIHIRRGDYVSNANANFYHGICGLDYYQHAIDKIESITSDPTYFIFSDDIDWCRQNLKLSKEPTFIAHNQGANSHFDMHLMSLCKHNIIANSSFSWWGAWLNKNQNKCVIAPKQWFSVEKNTADLLPIDWLRI